MVVFIDIDGTIVDDATQAIPQSAVEAVAALKRNGHTAIVNTGRPYGNIDPRVRAMPFAGFVCACGAELLLNGEWVFRKLPSLQVCRYVIESVRQCGMQVLYETEDGLLADGEFSSGSASAGESLRMQKKGFPTYQVDDLEAPQFVKFVTHDAPGCNRAEFLRRMVPYFTPIIRDGSMVEYVLRGCSKAAGMEAVLSYLGESREHVYAIGDSTNDLTMFAMASHTAAIGDSSPALKEQADFITATVMEDGIEKALKHFGLI